MEASASEGTVKASQSGSTLTSFPSWKTQKPIPRDMANPSSLMALQPSSVLSAKEVVRRPKTRPLSHPVIPQVFVEQTGLSRSVDDEGSSQAFDPGSFDSSDSRQPATLKPAPRLYDDPSQSALSIQTTNHGAGELYDLDYVSPRTRKRFSMPAIALQTTSVTATPKASGEGRSKRFSLVLGGAKQKAPVSQLLVDDGAETQGNGDPASPGLKRGGAVVRLQELLERSNGS